MSEMDCGPNAWDLGVRIAERDMQIARLTERLAAAEARIIHTPSPEHWAEVQSQLASCKERLAASETYRNDLLDRLASAEADAEDRRETGDACAAKYNRAVEVIDELRAKLAAAVVLLREAREAYRCGYESDCVPLMRLLYLSDRWDEQAKAAGGE